MAEEVFNTLGWQGVLVDVPENWSVVGFYGDDKAGYFRIDSSIESVLEMRWNIKGKKEPDLKKSAHKFIDGIKKGLLKQNKKMRFEREVKYIEGSDFLNFTWDSEEKHGRGIIFLCKETMRVIFAHLFFSRNECKAQIINKIFASIRDDQKNNKNVRYSFYGLDFQLPHGFKSHKPILMSAYLSLVFKRKFEKAVIEQRNLAGAILKNKDLSEWFKIDVALDFKAYNLKYEEIKINNFNAIKVHGGLSGFKGLMCYIFNFWRCPVHFECYAWHNTERNCIFTIRYLYNKNNAVLDVIYNSMLETNA